MGIHCDYRYEAPCILLVSMNSVTFTLIVRELQGLFWSMKWAVGLFVMEVPESTQVAKEKEGPIQVGQLLPE